MSYFSTTKNLVNICWLLLTQKPNEISKKCHFWQSQGNFKTKIWIEEVNKCWPNIFCQKLWCFSFLNSCQPSFCEIWWWFWVNLNFSMKINIFQNHEKMENMMMIHNFIEFVFKNIWGRLTRLWKAEMSYFSTTKNLVNNCWLLLTVEPNEINENSWFYNIERKIKQKNGLKKSTIVD